MPLCCRCCCRAPVLQADVDAGRLSSAQLETLAYANMRFSGPRQPGAGEAPLLLLSMHAVPLVLLLPVVL
jgi:hypothetical protein